MVGAQFGGGGFGDGRLGDEFPFAVYEFGEFIDYGFGDVGDDGEAAGHVAVEGAVANGDFGFVAGAEDQGAEFIGERHQEIAADAGLDVFFGGVFRASCEGPASVWR